MHLNSTSMPFLLKKYIKIKLYSVYLLLTHAGHSEDKYSPCAFQILISHFHVSS